MMKLIFQFQETNNLLLLYNYNHQLRMIPSKAKQLEKQKRFSQTKPNPAYQYKFPQHISSNCYHNRSSSIDKNKKLRLLTEYDESEQKYSQQKNYRKAYNSKKSRGNQYYSSKHSGNQVHSTKNNPRKNIELRLLFNKTKQNQQQKTKNKGYTTHHPLLKYVNNNKNRQHNQSPYTKEIQKIERTFNKLKKSTSKNKSTHNRQPSLNLKKNQIKINITKDVGRKSEQEQETVKTIKKKQNEEKVNENQDLQISSISENFGLTQEEDQVFGDRFPYGFEKIKLLGRGGFSLVWLGKHLKSGKQFAIKQIITQNTHQTHIKQIWFGTNFFTLGGVPKPQFSNYVGVKNLVRMYSYEINQKDTWIFYEKCGSSLGSNLYDIKAEKVYGDHKLYKIYYKPFYQSLSKNIHILKSLIIEICKSLVLLSDCEIVHSDLKTQNILIRFEENNDNLKLTEVKLIDYGSSFQFKHISQFSMATPQYMPPQILNYIIHQNQGEYEESLYNQVMQNYKNPWIVDMFSLGCVFLEIVVGVPLWMSLPLLVPNKTGYSYCQKEGLFAVKGRLFPQIIKKQRVVIGKLDHIIDNENYSRIVLTNGMKKVLKGMLEIDFSKRISPKEVIKILQEQKF